MYDLQVFDFRGSNIRTVLIDGDVWFVGKDVAQALGYKNPQEAIRLHVDDRDKGMREILTPSNGGLQNVIIINESGLYSLILSSRLPSAKEFKHWVTSVVIPSVMETGSYSVRDDENSPAVRENTQKILFPQHSAAVKAAEKITHKLFRCKKDEDFQEVLALDKFFELTFGVSALEIMGVSLVKKTVTKTRFVEMSYGGKAPIYYQEEVFEWEHNYNLNEIARKYDNNN